MTTRKKPKKPGASPKASRSKTAGAKQARGNGRQCVVVLGMHRSGTSAMAGTLNILGCDAPATPMNVTAANEKGYFESQRIYELHKEILTSAGSRWDDWLPISPGWFTSSAAEQLADRAAEMLNEEFGSSRFFVFKDPRVCRLLPFWEGVLADLSIEARYVITLRNPLEVAASLNKRDGFDRNLGLLMWLRHVLDAEAASRERDRCFTSYSQLLENWAHTVEKIQTELQVHLPRMSLNTVDEVETFLAKPLRNFQEPTANILQNPLISSWIRDAYAILERWTVQGEDTGDHKRLDEIRSAFDDTGPVFARLLQAGRESATRVNEMKISLDRVTGEKAAAQNELKGLKTALDTAGTEAASTAETLARRSAELDERGKELAEAREALKAARTEAASTAETLARRSAELDERGKELAETRDQIARMTRAKTELQTALESTQAQVEAQAEARDAAQNERDALRNELAQTRSALTQRSHEAEQTARELRDLQERHLARQIADKSELDTMRSAMSRIESDARDTQERLESQISAKTEQLGSLETTVKEQYRDLAEITRLLAEAEARQDRMSAEHAEDLTRERAAMASAREALNAAQQHWETERASIAEQRAQHLRETKALTDRLEVQARETAEMTRLLSETEATLSQTRQDHATQLAEERLRSERAEYAVTAIKSSTSWKAMAPIRALGTLFRRRD